MCLRSRVPKGKGETDYDGLGGARKGPSEYRKGKDLEEGKMCLRSRVPKGKSETSHPRRCDETLLSRWFLIYLSDFYVVQLTTPVEGGGVGGGRGSV